MFEPPAAPTLEDETTSVVIPECTAAEDIEKVLEDIVGRVNIVDGVRYRDLPDCFAKAAISYMWGTFYAEFHLSNRICCVDGSSGTLYSSGNLLSPDLAAWNLKLQPRRIGFELARHLMHPGPAPNWIMQFEWCADLHRPHRVYRKVLEGFFNEVGTHQTRVEEAWVLVKHQDIPLPARPPKPPLLLRILRWLSFLPYIGAVFVWLLSTLDTLTGTEGWTRRCKRHDSPPINPAVPYIVIYFNRLDQPLYGYYWLHWHETFVAPPRSFYGSAPPWPVHRLLAMMQGGVDME